MVIYTYVSHGGYGFRRWENMDVQGNQILSFNYPDGNKSIMICDIKDDFMLLFDNNLDRLMLVQSPNKILWTIDYNPIEFIYAYITQNNETKRVNVILHHTNNNSNLISIHNIKTGKLVNSVSYPENLIDNANSFGIWGNYIVGTIIANGRGTYLWSYDTINDKLVHKNINESKIQIGDYTWRLRHFNFIAPSLSSCNNEAYLYFSGSGMTPSAAIARFNLDTLLFIDGSDATNGETNGRECTYMGYCVGDGVNYILFKNSNVNYSGNWTKRRFYGISYIDEEIVWNEDLHIEETLNIKTILRDRGENENLWVIADHSGNIWLQQVSHTFTTLGDGILLKSKDEPSHNYSSTSFIFTSSYLFESDLEFAPTMKCTLINIIDNQYIFRLTKNNANNYNFTITNVYYNDVELSFSYDEATLTIHGQNDWTPDTEYICNVEVNWIDVNTNSNLTNYTEAVTFIDEDSDGENDYDYDIIIPDNYLDITNLKPYIEHRTRVSYYKPNLINKYNIRIANPVEGGTPWYNFIGTIIGINWRVRYGSETGKIVCSGTKINNAKNEHWCITGEIDITINSNNFTLDSSNRATIVLEVQTPTGEWITSDKFQINNYNNEYNYKWRYNGEDNDYLYFILDGDYSLTNNWYKPDYLYLYDGEEQITSRISNTISIVDGVATMKVSKSSYDVENIPKHGYWCHFRCDGYNLSSAPKGYGGVEKFEFTVKLQIRTTTISQYQFEVTQQNDKIYIANTYFTENVEVYKDGVKLEGSYDKDSGEIKFILPKDTPQELNGHTLNLQYKVFYNDNDVIKSFMQDFTYTTYASYFVELDPDFKDYYWDQLSPTPYGYNLYNGCMVSHGDYIYLVATAYDNGYKKLLLRYNIESDTWTELASPEYDVYKTKPVVYNNKIYVVGGQTYSTWDRVTKVQIYDIETDSWSYGTDCPRNQGPHELQPIEYNGKIYCFSGNDYDYPSPPNKMDIYDIETDSWESIETPYNLKKYSASCIDGKIYICNGTDSNYNYDTTLYIYDIEANTWTTGPNQPVATFGSSHGGGTMLDKFVVILGDFKESVKTMSFDYDISKNKWMRLPDAPNDLGYSYDNAKCCRNNNEFYVLKYQYFYRLTKPPVTYSNSYLYELDGVYYTETENGELVETTMQELNEDLFLTEGVSYINSDLIKPNTKVLYFKAKNKNEVPQLKYSGVYEGTTIIMDWDLQSEQGKTFNVLGDIYSDDNVRFLLSNNNGQTWKTFDGYEVVNCDIDNIKSNGMTYDIFTSLNASQLESFKGGTNSLRIVIYIEQYSVNGKTNIDHIRLRY